MKGVIFILILYVIVVSVLALTKYFLKNYFNKNYKGKETPAPKIYYVKNSVKPSPKKPQRVDIAVKGRIIEKED